MFRFLLAFSLILPAAAQVDQALAKKYFQEAAALCAREGGKTWGKSLCGPMVFADAATKTIATNQPVPSEKQPPLIGFANAIADWGGQRWSTYVWAMIPHQDEAQRGRLMLHELFHRIQGELGFLVNDGDNSHLDTLDGRYWIQLEWRALAKALGASGAERLAALRDALAFRAARRKVFPEAAKNEQPMEINEGLAQYTATVAAFVTPAEATADAIVQLREVLLNATFVRTFPYPSGAAYGILLDTLSPGWPRRVKPTDDLAQLAATAARVEPSPNAESTAKLYGGDELRAAEVKRAVTQKARVAELRQRFVEGPVLVLPPPRNASFSTMGMTPIPEGTVYPTYRTSPEWGSLEADWVLVAIDRSKLTLPAPASIEGPIIKGDGFTLKPAAGWIVRPGKRAGDYQLVKQR